MKLGIVGLPNVGKTTLFNGLTKAGAEIADYPFSTLEANVGIVPVPDFRLLKLGELYKSKKITPTTIKFTDIAGLVKGSAKGEGLGNKFLSYIREADAIIHVVQCYGNSSPTEDIETLNLELIFADLDTLTAKLDKARTAAKGDKKYLTEAALYEKIIAQLENGLPASSVERDEEEQILIDNCFLLTDKPVLYVANIAEEDIANDNNAKVKEIISATNGAEVLPVCAKVEAELSSLSDEERMMFMESYGIENSGLELLIKKSYQLLGLISYLTAGEKETRAWTVKEGTKAPQAAGKIHSDFERGFIRAEVVPYQILLDCGGYKYAKEQGKVRSEGKNYVIKDGDVVLFLFNV